MIRMFQSSYRLDVANRSFESDDTNQSGDDSLRGGPALEGRKLINFRNSFFLVFRMKRSVRIFWLLTKAYCWQLGAGWTDLAEIYFQYIKMYNLLRENSEPVM